MSRRKISQIILAICMILILAMVALFQTQAVEQVPAKALESLNYLPTGSFLKGIALGYDEAFADFLWVRTVGYYGSQVKSDRDFTWLTHMLRLITELDPMYESPYEFAGVILPSELERVDEGIAFLKMGIDNIPTHNQRYWLQHFYLGFCYMIYKDEPMKAAQHFEIASGYADSPQFLPLLVARLYARSNQPGVGLDIIQSVLDSTTPDNRQETKFTKALKKRTRELVVTQHIRMLENAIGSYVAIFDRMPTQLSDLVDGLVLPFIPIEPFGGEYFISDDGKQVLSTRSEGQLRIYAEKKHLPANEASSKQGQ